jgi:hypothetical protein
MLPKSSPYYIRIKGFVLKASYSPPYKATNQLPIGSQQAMINAAKLAMRLGTPINRLLTIRTNAMRVTGGGGIFRLGTQAECVRLFLDKNLRWMKYRDMPTANIWSREHAPRPGEHFHLAYHQRDELDVAFVNQIADWLDEDVSEWGTGGKLVAQSDEGSWNIKRCIRGNTSGCTTAAYIGKAEPNEVITARGKVTKNDRKPNHKWHGGFGPIEGNGKHAYRWGTSTLIGRTQRINHGYGE